MVIETIEVVALVVGVCVWKLLDVEDDEGMDGEVSGGGITQGPDAEDVEGKVGFHARR